MLLVIAMASMLIDHIGFIFFPGDEAYRIVGRIAFPLYCWFLVQGFRHTRDHGKYMRRLLWLACLSQIPFALALQLPKLNVIFTLLLSMAAMYAWERIPSEKRFPVLTAAAFAAAAIVPMDYGLYGVLLVFLYRYCDRKAVLVTHAILNAAFWLLYGPSYAIQMFSLLGSLLILLPLPERAVRRGRWLYRAFYPAHLAVLFALRALLKT
ncbi:conjugal transfer protein TraX [Cohnella sp. CFH 77786]|uniref:TraX family protein n=1 Tax=Cohnella sp. CFH 77786 TaxID=2662265 RepID=UPI001C60AF41|nr:TraX family protein [Cohnella sp. CFH 77786]MBW5446347.1 conjugal transfer protein TraX [Cohnella sp. CFH 77786]